MFMTSKMSNLEYLGYTPDSKTLGVNLDIGDYTPQKRRTLKIFCITKLANKSIYTLQNKVSKKLQSIKSYSFLHFSAYDNPP